MCVHSTGGGLDKYTDTKEQNTNITIKVKCKHEHNELIIIGTKEYY